VLQVGTEIFAQLSGNVAEPSTETGLRVSCKNDDHVRPAHGRCRVEHGLSAAPPIWLAAFQPERARRLDFVRVPTIDPTTESGGAR
jgi:hypothetical protein